MTNLYDEEGNLVEGAMTPEEAKKLQEEKEAATKEVTEIKDKLSKLENKDFNFKKLREMNEKEKEKLTAQEMELLQRQEKLEEDQKSFVQSQISSYKNDALAVVAGDNEELRKKILFHYNRIKDEAVSREDVFKKIREAATLAREENKILNPINSAMNFQGNPPSKQDKPESEYSKEMRGHWNISDEDQEKYGKEWKPKYK